MLNRDLDASARSCSSGKTSTPTRVLACETLTGPDLKAFNTFAEPRRVAPQRLDAAGRRQPDDFQAAAALVHGRARPGPRLSRRAFYFAPARSFDAVAHSAITVK